MSSPPASSARYCEIFFDHKTWSARYGPQFFTLDIPSFRVVESDGGRHTRYLIVGRAGKLTWQQERRYSEFAGLADKLKRELAVDSSLMPAKHFPLFAETDELRESRREALQAYLWAALGSDRTVPASPAVADFLGWKQLLEEGGAAVEAVEATDAAASEDGSLAVEAEAVEEGKEATE
eukprot:PLAT3905.1.p2 GENE.PLAT3905.1~~PLAT3905.1.p2  ORF type:complete len:179 (-),score=69.54 PLAT3905.1:28-564(-)